jgi:hypothetical protein
VDNRDLQLYAHPVDALPNLRPLCYNTLVQAYVLPGDLYYIDYQSNAPMRLTDVETGVWYILSWSDSHKLNADFELCRCLPKQHLRLYLGSDRFVTVKLTDTEMLDIMSSSERSLGVIFSYSATGGFDYSFKDIPEGTVSDIRGNQYIELSVANDKDYWQCLVTKGYLFNKE